MKGVTALQICDATAGHMGIKRTTACLSERFVWNGVVKDVKEMVSAPIFFQFKYTLTEQNCFKRYESLYFSTAI